MIPVTRELVLVAVFAAAAAALAVLAIYDHVHGDEHWVGVLTRRQLRATEIVLTLCMLAAFLLLTAT